MKNISPSAIAPIISVLFLAISYVTGHPFSHDIQVETSTIVAAVATLGVTIWGIFKSHIKEESKPTVKSVATETAETAKAVETAATTIANETETQTLNNATVATNTPNAGEGVVQQ
jgi:uncharacterized membrane protein